MNNNVTFIKATFNSIESPTASPLWDKLWAKKRLKIKSMDGKNYLEFFVVNEDITASYKDTKVRIARKGGNWVFEEYT